MQWGNEPQAWYKSTSKISRWHGTGVARATNMTDDTHKFSYTQPVQGRVICQGASGTRKGA